ncbi:protein translocase subunit SecD [Spirochaeta africana]|uniref:Protein translocase subunit SecD n=1 Tax=Spirochaeta africana (strain ATCC 700263 / DSM 8902 / Z-7692) TaxID=889378 RepID=H9UFL8_SPIAZ|nr:protein translocase subunit SecD [Spirochaeta africana]AFG36311.1 protein-export membrane protein, SecD/SecF family [Spirochaeta africana DSM 8902]
MSKRFRFLTILVFVGIAAAFLYPTVDWYFFVPEDMKELAAGSRVQIRDYAQRQAREELELLTTAAAAGSPEDYSEVFPHVVTAARRSYRERGMERPSVWTAENMVRGFRAQQDLYDVLEAHHRETIMSLKDRKNRIIELGLDLSGGVAVTLEADRESLAARLGREPSGEEMSQAIDLAVEILTNRIDQFGVTEPQIRRQDDNRISIEIPGDDDAERVNSFLMGRGSLNFHIVDDEATEQLMELQRNNPGWNPNIDGTPDFVPAGSRVVEFVTRDAFGIDQTERWIVIREDLQEFGLDGSHITEAQVSRNPITNEPTVNFVLDSEGSDIFARLTRDNVNSSMAVVMDNRVRSHAVIREEIPTGNVQISGGFTVEEANDLATVLRTAALPVDLNIINQTSVGASLGAEAIRMGLMSIAVGFSLVIAFMLLYYRRAGLVAVLALVLNLFFIMALLSAFNLTLTLTSIAGIILTVGMAVDANVIIYERIREEYRLGKSAQASIETGYQKAFWTVMDANITTFIAAVFLSQLGTGPIQGFAITLAVGIVCSMFTALFVSRLVFDVGTDVFKRKKLKIGWGV